MAAARIGDARDGDDGRRRRGRTRLDPDTRREQILDAADDVLHGRDPADVPFEEIADAAGVSRALVYNYFGDRNGLIAAVYRRSFRRLDVALLEAVDPQRPPIERARRIVGCYLRFASDNAEAWTLLATTSAMAIPEVQAARDARFERIAAQWGGTPDASMVVRALVGMLEAATVDLLDRPDVDLDHSAEVLFNLLWSGLSSLEGFGIVMPEAANPLAARSTRSAR